MINSSVKRSRVGDKFASICSTLLNRYLPQRARRAIFASSLVAYMKNLSCPDQQLANRLTRVLDLSCDPTSLMFPMGMQHRIWKSLTLHSIQVQAEQAPSATEIHDFAESVLEYTPSWLCYDTARSMREDVYQIITNFHPTCVRSA